MCRIARDIGGVSDGVFGVSAHIEEPVGPRVHVDDGDDDAEDVEQNATRDLQITVGCPAKRGFKSMSRPRIDVIGGYGLGDRGPIGHTVKEGMV